MNGPAIVYVERLDGNTVLGFGDGSMVVVSTALLEEVLPGGRRGRELPVFPRDAQMTEFPLC